jgi:hypothetical protein
MKKDEKKKKKNDMSETGHRGSWKRQARQRVFRGKAHTSPPRHHFTGGHGTLPKSEDSAQLSTSQTKGRHVNATGKVGAYQPTSPPLH